MGRGRSLPTRVRPEECRRREGCSRSAPTNSSGRTPPSIPHLEPLFHHPRGVLHGILWITRPLRGPGSGRTCTICAVSLTAVPITNAELSERVAGRTVPLDFLATVRARPESVALRAKDGDDVPHAHLHRVRRPRRSARHRSGRPRRRPGRPGRDADAQPAGIPRRRHRRPSSSAPRRSRSTTRRRRSRSSVLAGHCRAEVAIVEARRVPRSVARRARRVARPPSHRRARRCAGGNHRVGGAAHGRPGRSRDRRARRRRRTISSP